MDDAYENIDDYNQTSKRQKVIVVDEIIEDIMRNKDFQAIFKELFIRCKN